MKYFIFSIQCLVAGFLGIIALNWDGKLKVEAQVSSSEPFFLDGKQYHCALTTEQVEVDLKQEELYKLMEKRNGNTK